MPPPDSTESHEVLHALQKSWNAAARCYVERRINSERCLQSTLFYYFKQYLPKDYFIYVEATVRIPDDTKDLGYRRVAVDTLVCKENTIYAAIELKFSPKGQSKLSGVRKDIFSLSTIKNRRKIDDRITIEIPRYRNTDEDLMTLSVHKSNKLIFAAFGKKEGARLNQTNFWLAHGPAEGRWKSHKTMPSQLCIALAHTSEDGRANTVFFGPPFTRQLTRQRMAASDA